MYRAETITRKKHLLRNMDVFQNSIMRKPTWFGQLKRSDLPVRAVYEGMVSSKRRRGRTIWRWRNGI